MLCLILTAEGERKRESSEAKGKSVSSSKGSTAAASFGFRELAAATRGFKEVNLIGEGGFGRVYKGRLSTGEASFIFTVFIFYFFGMLVSDCWISGI